MEILEGYKLEDKYKVLIFADADTNGEIIEYEAGQRVVPNRQWQYFFFVDRYVWDILENYKVVDGQLVAKDEELEAQIQQLYFGQ